MFGFNIWNGQVSSDFLYNQKDLFVFLKDGYTFFSERKDLLISRILDLKKQTKIMIVHPEYNHIAAVADMDSNKKGCPEKQKNDCVKAIIAMQDIRKAIKYQSKADISKKILFLGYRLVPTWNGFIGSHSSIISFYTTRPYRGKLPTLKFIHDKKNFSSGNINWGEDYKTDFNEIERITKEEYCDCDLWKYKPV